MIFWHFNDYLNRLTFGSKTTFRCYSKLCSHCLPLAPSLKEISENAVFVEDTTGTTDICQGQLGESISTP